jgi:hypothetical protein
MAENILNIKVGSVVAYSTPSSWGRSILNTSTVKKITPTGRVRLENGLYFDADGREITSDTRVRHLLSFEEYEERKEQQEEEHRRRDLVMKIQSTNFQNLTDDQLTRIAAIIGEDRK